MGAQWDIYSNSAVYGDLHTVDWHVPEAAIYQVNSKCDKCKYGHL